MQVPVGAQETFLINVASVLGAVNQIQRQTQDVAIVPADQVLKSQPVTRLGLTDQCLLFAELHCRCLARISVECDAHPHRIRRRTGLCFGAPGFYRAIRRIQPAISRLSRGPLLGPLARPCPYRRGDRRLVSTRGGHFGTIGRFDQGRFLLEEASHGAARLHRLIRARLGGCSSQIGRGREARRQGGAGPGAEAPLYLLWSAFRGPALRLSSRVNR